MGNDDSKTKNQAEGDQKENKDAIVKANDSKSVENDANFSENDKAGNEQEKTSASKNKKSSLFKRKKSHKKHHFPWITTIAILLVVVLAGANYWLYQQGEDLKQVVNQVTQQQSDSSQRIADLGQDINETMDQQATVVTQIQQNEQVRQSMMSSLDQMSQQLKSLATTKGKDPLYWRVSEVEYLLTVANHRLVLERDVRTAKAALQDADIRLRSIGDPGLIPVREKITQEINQLENVTLPDIPGLAAQLKTLVDGLEQLPFVKKDLSMESPSLVDEEKEFSGFTAFIKQVWTDLVNGLFKVQRSDQPVEPLLPLEEKQYLIHNLGLKLEQSRLALLRGDTALFQQNLVDIELWVAKYFDRDAPSVTNLLQTVQNLKSIELQPELPDVSASLRELRSWLDQQKNVVYRSRDTSMAHYQAESVSP